MIEFGAAYAHVNQLYAHYTDAVWRQDVAGFGDCFAADAQWRISGRLFAGREQIMDGIGQIMGRFRRVLITFRAPIVSWNGDEGHGRVYVTEHCAWKDDSTNISIGVYYDRYILREDRCFFKWRLFQLHYRGPEDLTGTFFDNADFGPAPAMPPLDADTADHASRHWA